MRKLFVTWIFSLLFFQMVLIEKSRGIEIFIDRHTARAFPNVSLGLEHVPEYGHQCNLAGVKRSLHKNGKYQAMTFTPNRRFQNDTVSDAIENNVQLGFVLALGGHSNQYYDYGPFGGLNGLMALWDSWTENFFAQVSNSTSIVLLLDERDFKRQNFTKSVSEYIDKIVIGNMGAKAAECVVNRQQHRFHISPRNIRHPPHVKRRPIPNGCTSNSLNLDQGYKVYHLDVRKSESSVQLPLIIFAGVHRFPVPDWAKNEDEERLFVHWRPRRMGRFKTNYGYVKMTNWYSYHMLNLQILDYFDYAGKLDNDVSFVAPFPEPNLPRLLAERETQMLVSANGWYYDEPRVAQGIRQCLNSYIHEETKRCQGAAPAAGSAMQQLIAGGIDSPVFWESNLNATFRAHFLVYWLGLYAAPETKSMARYWNDWNPGMWDYRWGDQQYWPRPMAMFGSGDLDREVFHYDTINTDNEKYVVHKLWPRHFTVGANNYFSFAGSNRTMRDAVYEDAVKRCRKWVCT